MYGNYRDNDNDGDIPYSLSKEDQEWLDRRNGRLPEHLDEYNHFYPFPNEPYLDAYDYYEDV